MICQNDGCDAESLEHSRYCSPECHYAGSLSGLGDRPDPVIGDEFRVGLLYPNHNDDRAPMGKIAGKTAWLDFPEGIPRDARRGTVVRARIMDALTGGSYKAVVMEVIAI